MSQVFFRWARSNSGFTMSSSVFACDKEASLRHQLGLSRAVFVSLKARAFCTATATCAARVASRAHRLP